MSAVSSLSRLLALAAAGAGLVAAAREIRYRLAEVDLAGSTVLVTGGSRGLGFLLAREFGRSGCRVAICARDREGLERARADLEHEGIEVLAQSADVTDRQQVQALVQQTTADLGRIDVLVNNAGIIQVGPVQAMALEDFEAAMGVMFWGTVYPTLAVLPQMLERRSGRIVNVTSIGGRVSVPHLLPYNCAKFAAVGFSEGLRAELAPYGIRVTTILPGPMRTGSYLNVAVKGRQQEEALWFALGAALPLISMDAERAARQIVEATRRGEPERTLSVTATLLARFHGLFPGATADLLGLVNRLALPRPNGSGAEAARARDVLQRMRSPALDLLTRLGRSAAERFHQNPASNEDVARRGPGRDAP